MAKNQLQILTIFILIIVLLNFAQHFNYINQFQKKSRLKGDKALIHDFAAIEDLKERLIPKKDAPKIIFTYSVGRQHSFSWETISRDGEKFVMIAGNTLSTITKGLSKFYEVECGMKLASWGNQVSKARPKGCFDSGINVAPKRYTTNSIWRYYQNQVTAAYSTPFWGMNRWRQEIDWMALQGINLIPVLDGQEALLYELFYNEYGIDLKPHLTGEVYFAWHRMGNLKSLAGPPQVKYMQDQAIKAKKIISRLIMFGIKPILPGFNGFIPDAMAKKYNLKCRPSSLWSGFEEKYSGLCRIDPTSKLYKELWKKFIERQLQFYDVTSSQVLFSFDVFNEMDPDVVGDLNQVMSNTFKAVDAVSTGINLVMQMWCFAHSPIWTEAVVTKFLSSVPPNRLILLDLHGEKRPVWPRFQSLFTKYKIQVIWCVLQNFGASDGIGGELKKTIQYARDSILNNPVHTGVGLSMEGIERNEIIFNAVLDVAWNKNGVQQAFDFEDWFKTWVTSRYNIGTQHLFSRVAQVNLKTMEKAWRCAITVSYDRPEELGGWGPPKSIIELQPGFDMVQGNFQPTKIHYDPGQFLTCAKLIVQTASSFLKSTVGNVLTDKTPLHFDIIDFVRQTYSDHALLILDRIEESFKADDGLDGLKSASDLMLKLIERLDALLAMHPSWGVSPHLCSSNTYQTHRIQYNTLITRWDESGETLHSYASRQANGLMKGLYFRRWKKWTESLIRLKTANVAYNSNSVRVMKKAYDKLEREWIDTYKLCNTNYAQIKEVVSVGREMLDFITVVRKKLQP